MEWWLIQDNDKLRLPVPPNQFEVKTGSLNGTVNVENLGEVSFLGKSSLSTISIETLWPDKEYSFCQYKGFIKPYEATSMIEKWRLSGKPIRLLITETPINTQFSIESFAYSKRDATKDVYLSLDLKQYKQITVVSQVINAPQVPSTPPRPVNNSSPATYTVKKGDTLWAIAKKFYGNGSKYTDIVAKNGIKNPNLIYPGQVFKI